MQDMSDFLDHFDGINQQSNDPTDLIDQGLWPTSRGDLIPISEMDDQHLRNTINRVRRNNWRMLWLPSLQEELQLRTEQADHDILASEIKASNYR